MLRLDFIKKVGAAMGLAAAAPQLLEGLEDPGSPEELAASFGDLATSCRQIAHDSELTVEALVRMRDTMQRWKEQRS